MKKTITLLFLPFALYSAPAYSHLKEFKNADGSTFYAIPKGNHHLNWIETPKGEILKYNNKTKNFEFAQKKDGKFLLLGKVYKEGKDSIETIESQNYQRYIKDDLY